MRRRLFLIAGALMLRVLPTLAEEPGVIASMETLAFRQPAAKGRAELVDGKVGKAVRFQFDADARSTFFTSNIRGTPDWDRAAGFSFWVKGDGQDGFGGIEFIYDDDYAVRYDLAFPVRGTEWTKVTVAWNDLIPVLPGPRAKPLGGAEGNQPSKLSGLWVGKWWYWGDYPALGFAIDEIRLEAQVDRPAPPSPPADPLGRVLAKVLAGKPVTVVTMGDSLTDVRHWANRERAWPSDLKARIDRWTHSDLTIVNPAIGGTQLKQGLVLIPTWLARAPEPDLVTIFFVGNDRAAGMTGEAFERACIDAVGRVRRATGGRADVLLMTTVPSLDRPKDTADLAAAVRRAAKATNAGLADTEASFIVAAGQDPFDRKVLYVHDRVHLSRAGHEDVSADVVKAIYHAGR